MKLPISEKMRNTLRVIFQKRIETEDSKRNEKRNKVIVYLILALVSLVLTILNIVNKYWLMTGTTAGLFVICVICVLIVWKTENRVAPDILLSLGIAFLFTYYAISGQNEGFAILWILLVPAVGMLLLSFRVGLGVSVYFLLLLIIIFYTPVKDMLPAITNFEPDAYTKTFMVRFPLLYLADFLTAIVLTSQKVYYLNKAQNNSLYDQMTGLRNRRYFMDLVSFYGKDFDERPLETTIIFLDLNNLKLINDKFGHHKGDAAIKKIAALLVEHFGDNTEYLYRVGGDEFVVVFDDKKNKVEDMLTKFNDKVKEQSHDGYTLSISCGYAKKREYLNDDFKSLLSIAEKNMYKDKEDYYKNKGVKRYRGSYEDFN